MEQWGSTIIQAILSAAVLGIMKVMLSQTLEQMTKRLDESERRTQTYERELLEFKLEAANRYVQRDDFLRVTAVTDAKIDAMNEKLDKMMLLQKDKS